jgi:hypothetical protein
MWLSLIDLYESFVSYPTKTVASFHFKSLWVNDLLGVKIEFYLLSFSLKNEKL